MSTGLSAIPSPRLMPGNGLRERLKFVSDIKLPRMLHGRILRSPHPHARILHIDTSKARRLPGVKAVVTSEDTPKSLSGRERMIG